jgi:hypothetical protein
MAKARNTFQKSQREMQKKRKAQEKHDERQRKKTAPPRSGAPAEQVKQEGEPR